MADLTRLPGVFEQIKLVAGLRWLILKNGLRKKNNVWDLIGMIWVAVFSGLLVVGVAFAFYFGGYEFIRSNRAAWLALLYWAVFLWWQAFPIFIAGFGSNFEFAGLLRFPLSLRAFYLLGLGYGLSDFAAISSICWILSLMAGVASARFSIIPAMLLVSVLFILINVTLERLIGSWLEKILAKRKAREIFLALFVMGAVSMNFLNPAFHKWSHGAKPEFGRWLAYFAWLPGSLAGNTLAAATRPDLRAFWLGMAGLVGWGVITSGLLWRRFAAQYAGEELSESAAPAVAAKRKEKQRSDSVELPRFLSPQIAAVVIKEFRYLTRNGFAFLTLLLPPIMVIFFTYQFGPGSMLKEHSVKPGMFFPGIMAYLILILLSPAYNSFAFENKGIQTYFLAPIRFRDVLLGKNLFLILLVAFELGLSLLLLTWRIGWPGTPLFAATITAGMFAVMGQLAIANWSSLTFPKKMEIGKMKGQRNSGVAVWTAFGVQIVLGGICAVVLFAGQWTHNPWLPPTAFAALTAAAIAGYVASLDGLSVLAEKKKELLIETLTR
jgi:ABC-2 type transport system permease protein